MNSIVFLLVICIIFTFKTLSIVMTQISILVILLILDDIAGFAYIFYKETASLPIIISFLVGKSKNCEKKLERVGEQNLLNYAILACLILVSWGKVIFF